LAEAGGVRLTVRGDIGQVLAGVRCYAFEQAGVLTGPPTTWQHFVQPAG
jgi:hypothetical protein